jgi:hypothetical protein
MTSIAIIRKMKTAPMASRGGVFVFIRHFRLAAGITQGIFDMTFLKRISTNSNVSLRSAYRKRPMLEIFAELTGSNRCDCQSYGISTSGHARVLAACRELLAAGVDPDSALSVYRNGVLALRIRPIRAGARLAVEDGETGIPKFRLARLERRGAASPARQTAPRVSRPSSDGRSLATGGVR